MESNFAAARSWCTKLRLIWRFIDTKGGREAGRKFIEALRVFSHLANVGDAKSLVIHPASTTHYRMSDADLKQAGIGPGTVRLSIGLEDVEDLIQDLERALAVASKSK